MGHPIVAIFIVSYAYLYMWLLTSVILKVIGGDKSYALFIFRPLRNAWHIETNEWIAPWWYFRKRRIFSFFLKARQRNLISEMSTMKPNSVLHCEAILLGT